MYIGVDFYPEHWPRKLWDRYASLMQKANFNVVRLAEFAWVFMEPEEGRFEFGWLDEAIATLRKHGISVILGTPTAVMPAWVARKYPQCLVKLVSGQRWEWGVRRDNCFSSPTYRTLSQRITTAMADHYADNPAVIGWQTDNEFGWQMCYCDTCRADFQYWLRERYKTIDALNAAWGMHFWGHCLSQWSEVPLPIDLKCCNPGLYLDWRRFYSWQNVRFQREQVLILRRQCPKQFITHNFMGTYSTMINYYDLAKDLDFVSWDNYPIGEHVKWQSAAACDLMRGMKSGNVWVMEQTAGPPGWGFFNSTPRPGQIRQVAFHHMARGADGQLWFRWRTCTVGREQYWHGLLGHDGKPGRRYKEAATVAGEFKKLAKHVEGTTVKSQVAIIFDYESCWAIENQPGFEKNNYKDAIHRYYRPLFEAGFNVDLVPPSTDLSRYRIVIAPDLNIMPDELSGRLASFVAAGGVLLTDCRTGVKDETNRCHERTLPGLLSRVLGITITEYEAVNESKPYPLVADKSLPGSFNAIHYADWITPKGAKVLARYQPWHVKKFAAATVNKHGKGSAFYIGTVIKEEEFYDLLMDRVLEAGRIRPVLKPPKGVEASVRQGSGRKLLFLINHLDEPKVVDVPEGKTELLSGMRTGKTVKLSRYGVAVLRL